MGKVVKARFLGRDGAADVIEVSLAQHAEWLLKDMHALTDARADILRECREELEPLERELRDLGDEYWSTLAEIERVGPEAANMLPVPEAP